MADCSGYKAPKTPATQAPGGAGTAPPQTGGANTAPPQTATPTTSATSTK